VGQRVGGWVIHFPAVVCTSSATTVQTFLLGSSRFDAVVRDQEELVERLTRQ
jgi:hypothetical protein